MIEKTPQTPFENFTLLILMVSLGLFLAYEAYRWYKSEI